jgi:hypothetical protein
MTPIRCKSRECDRGFFVSGPCRSPCCSTPRDALRFHRTAAQLPSTRDVASVKIRQHSCTSRIDVVSGRDVVNWRRSITCVATRASSPALPPEHRQSDADRLLLRARSNHPAGKIQGSKPSNTDACITKLTQHKIIPDAPGSSLDQDAFCLTTDIAVSRNGFWRATNKQSRFFLSGPTGG